MSRRSRCALAAVVLPALAALAAPEPLPPPTRVAAVNAVPYRIILRSRHGHVTPTGTSKKSQTAGGYIDVAEVEPNTVAVLMHGSVVAGPDCKPSQAAMQFDLTQDFEIVPTRTGLRPPRLILAGRVVGTLLTSTAPGGVAEQAPACAGVASGGTKLLGLCVSHHGASDGENLSLNCREGPVEAVVLPGCFNLHGTFAISASLPKAPKHCPNAAVVADFDPRPQIDSAFNTALKPFRAVPRQMFGFRLVLRVIEDPAPLVRPAGPGSDVVPTVELRP